METTNQRKYFKGLRALALTALFCTIALTIFIWGEALTPGDKSAIQSMKVSDNIQSAMKSDESAPPVSAVTGYVVKSVRRDGKVLTSIIIIRATFWNLASSVFLKTPTPQNFTSSAVLTRPKITYRSKKTAKSRFSHGAITGWLLSRKTTPTTCCTISKYTVKASTPTKSKE